MSRLMWSWTGSGDCWLDDTWDSDSPLAIGVAVALIVVAVGVVAVDGRESSVATASVDAAALAVAESISAVVAGVISTMWC